MLSLLVQVKLTRSLVFLPYCSFPVVIFVWIYKYIDSRLLIKYIVQGMCIQITNTFLLCVFIYFIIKHKVSNTN